MQNHDKKKSEKKTKNQDSMDKTNFFRPSNFGVVSATWLHVGAP
jgi:hypothetical protein